MLTTKQLNNGRFQVTASDYDYNRFSLEAVLAILWRSFSTEQEAKTFIAKVNDGNVKI